MDIPTALVKELRAKTGAGVMDCKAALAEAGGNLDIAVDWLRKKGVAVATKRADRTAIDGLIGVASVADGAAMIEVNSETDFVAKNSLFQSFVRTVAELVLANLCAGTADIKVLEALVYPLTGRTVGAELTQLAVRIGENIKIRRACVLFASKGVVASYIHNTVGPGLGKIGALVSLEASGDRKQLATFGHQLAMHITAAAPRFLNISSVDRAVLEHERAILTEQARDSGKAENLISKMVEGRLRRFYEDVVLSEQVYVINGESRVSQAIEDAAMIIGSPIKVSCFKRFSLGEQESSAVTVANSKEIQLP